MASVTATAQVSQKGTEIAEYSSDYIDNPRGLGLAGVPSRGEKVTRHIPISCSRGMHLSYKDTTHNRN